MDGVSQRARRDGGVKGGVDDFGRKVVAQIGQALDQAADRFAAKDAGRGLCGDLGRIQTQTVARTQLAGAVDFKPGEFAGQTRSIVDPASGQSGEMPMQSEG